MLKQGIPCLMAVILLLTACQQPAPDQGALSVPQQVEQTQEQAQPAQRRSFVDSAGRTVQLPQQIERVAASGVPSQLVLLSICPDKLVGLARDFTEESKKYLPKQYQSMEIFGQFYGKNANLNMEALIKAAPDVIIDLGEYKDSIKADMDALQEQMEIPVIFIEADLKSYDKAFEMLGELLGEEEAARKLSQYAKDSIALADKASGERKDEERKSVYLALGDNGLSTNAKGSYHAQVIDLVGAVNAADVQKDSKGGGSEISMEQLLLWNPDVILAYEEDLYQLIRTDAAWSNLDAVKNGRVYKVPTAPFNVVSDPPSVNRLLGIHWLGHLLYPEKFEFDAQKLIDFSNLFYHTSLTQEDAKDILLHSSVE